MDISPKKMFELIKNSSLTRDEQNALIDSLEHLSQNEILELAEILEKDVTDMEKIIVEAKVKQNKAALKMKVKMDEIKVYE